MPSPSRHARQGHDIPDDEFIRRANLTSAQTMSRNANRNEPMPRVTDGIGGVSIVQYGQWPRIRHDAFG